eukprot:CAMPEP_0180148354 /NCGR_PEP_ID=MMETSP0986-20121125/19923_1 /TAXON_ID=697907 /ORGANISM="non described non described, Strain CCMP2293" /LENGTH=170 /DNA_ID=CAMNT_0022094321 /DNA_START=171 /DNA_END=686 /DNA_ORIENTATION=+
MLHVHCSRDAAWHLKQRPPMLTAGSSARCLRGSPVPSSCSSTITPVPSHAAQLRSRTTNPVAPPSNRWRGTFGGCCSCTMPEPWHVLQGLVLRRRQHCWRSSLDMWSLPGATKAAARPGIGAPASGSGSEARAFIVPAIFRSASASPGCSALPHIVLCSLQCRVWHSREQ